VAITSANVLLIAPELSSLSSNQWTAILAQVYLQMDADVWDDWLDLGATYLAAHLATVGPMRQGTAGAIQSESAGNVSRAYAVSVASDGAALRSTSYGSEYARLMSMLGGARGPWVI
jgi:hypothetical protein